MSTLRNHQRYYALFDKGLAELSRRNYARVLKIAAKLHKVRFSGAFELEARARYEMGDAQEATRVLEAGLRKYPRVYILASYLGEYQSNQGHFLLAIEAFDRARNGEQNADSFADLNIAICYGRMGLHDRSAEYLAKVNFSSGYYGWHHYWLSKARAEWRLGNYDQFLSDCEEGIALAMLEKREDVRKLNAWIYGYRAEFFAKNGDMPAAERDLNSARELDKYNEQYLRAFRIIHGKQVSEAICFRVVLEGSCDNAPGLSRKMGMLNNFEILAETKEDLIPLAQLHAEPWQTWSSISSVKSETKVTDAHLGVTWIAEGLILYGEYNWLDRLKSRFLGAQVSTLD